MAATAPKVKVSIGKRRRGPKLLVAVTGLPEQQDKQHKVHFKVQASGFGQSVEMQARKNGYK